MVILLLQEIWNNSTGASPNLILKHNELKIIPEIQRYHRKVSFEWSLFYVLSVLTEYIITKYYVFIKLNIDFRNGILFCPDFQECFKKWDSFLDGDMRLIEEKSYYFKGSASMRVNVLDIWSSLKYIVQTLQMLN